MENDIQSLRFGNNEKENGNCNLRFRVYVGSRGLSIQVRN